MAVSCEVRKCPFFCLTRRLITVFEILDLWILSRITAVNFESAHHVFFKVLLYTIVFLCLDLKRGPFPSGLDAPVHSYYMFLLSHRTWFYQRNNVQCEPKVMKLIIVQVFEIPFLLPHQTLLLNSLLRFSLDMRDQISIQTQSSRLCSFICLNIYAYV
jgi:hypothetical protein